MIINKNKLYNEAVTFTFVIPVLVFFIAVVIIPFVYGFGLAFTDWDGVSQAYNYIGLKNFIYLFTDTDSLLPIKNTLFFTVLDVVLVNFVGLLMALAVNREFKGAHLVKTIFFMPIIVSIVLSGFIWSYIYSFVFPYLKLVPLFGSTSTVMIGLIIVSVWRDSGFTMVIYYAGLRSIPADLIEAAEIDGANAVQKTRYITIPMLAPTFTINISLVLGWALKVFELPLTATGGGPGRASETFAVYVYKYTFARYMVGYGQASAILMMVIVFAASALVSAILRKRELEI